MADICHFDLDDRYEGSCPHCGTDLYSDVIHDCPDKPEAVYHGPACFCSSRATRRIEGTTERECEKGHRFVQRVTVAGLVSFTPEEAFHFDRDRKGERTSLPGASPQERPAPIPLRIR